MLINKSHNITIITPNYPMPGYPARGAFVEQLARQWVNLGLHVNVVAPLSVPDWIRSMGNPRQEISPAGESILYPRYLSLSNRCIGPVDLDAFSRNRFTRAAMKAALSLNTPDFYYGKFLLRGGVAALRAGVATGRPAFADMGESRFRELLTGTTESLARETLAQLAGIVCVSQRLKDEIIELGADPGKVLLAPNEADTSRFFPMDRNQCREQLGLPLDACIVAFTGHFIERKGPLRVLEAINRVDNVYGVFMGDGQQFPTGERVLHAGTVPNSDLPLWLNAADIFVLPTLAEGSCNAINEALACGLPVISSDIPDVSGQVDRERVTLVDPMDVSALAGAIERVKKGLEHGTTGKRSEDLPKSDGRAREIYQWIVSRIEDKN